MLTPKKMPRRFMLADDDHDDVGFFRDALFKMDPSIILYSTCNGRELLNALNSGLIEKPNIIFLDINMPEMDGWECLDEFNVYRVFKKFL